MICEIEFDYSKKFTPDEQALLRTLTSKEVKFDDNGTLDWSCREQVMPLEDALQFGEVTVKKVITGGVQKQLRDIVTILREFKPVAPMNERCNVVVPGIGLLAIKRVQILTDCCTDHLQTWLDKGWQILAICPQPDSRRPDYVIGNQDVSAA